MEKYKKIITIGWILVILQFILYNLFLVPEIVRIILSLGITATIAVPLYLAWKEKKLSQNDLLVNGAIILFNLYPVFQIITGN